MRFHWDNHGTTEEDRVHRDMRAFWIILSEWLSKYFIQHSPVEAAVDLQYLMTDLLECQARGDLREVGGELCLIGGDVPGELGLFQVRYLQTAVGEIIKPTAEHRMTDAELSDWMAARFKEIGLVCYD